MLSNLGEVDKYVLVLDILSGEDWKHNLRILRELFEGNGLDDGQSFDHLLDDDWVQVNLDPDVHLLLHNVSGPIALELLKKLDQLLWHKVYFQCFWISAILFFEVQFLWGFLSLLLSVHHFLKLRVGF